MNVLTRWDPLDEALELQRVMNQVMQRSGNGTDGPQQLDLSMDIYETPESYEIEAAMPGVQPEDVEITVNNNVLTIRGEVQAEEERDGKNYRLRERRVGVFVRSITLPSSVNVDAIEAHYDNGVLKLRLPKAEEAKPRRIQVKPNGNQSESTSSQSSTSQSTKSRAKNQSQGSSERD